ncbi:MAG: MupG family TIM beta-alpha barrel fold protein, partial [Coriobacteriales bacterium]|nr:MupG family TIM beta-alpha barrel fold protein [Coriobacteriales bacterium]
MTVLGVSVYPDIRPLEEIRTYLELAARYGFTRVFTSMFSVKGTNEQILAYFRDLDAVAHENGMKVSLDIEPHFMRRIGATPDDLSVFADINADILRMDGACSEDENVAMLNNPYGIQIEYNASALTPQVIESLHEVEMGAWEG